LGCPAILSDFHHGNQLTNLEWCIPPPVTSIMKVTFL